MWLTLPPWLLSQNMPRRTYQLLSTITLVATPAMVMSTKHRWVNVSGQRGHGGRQTSVDRWGLGGWGVLRLSSFHCCAFVCPHKISKTTYQKLNARSGCRLHWVWLASAMSVSVYEFQRPIPVPGLSPTCVFPFFPLEVLCPPFGPLCPGCFSESGDSC